MQAYANRVEKRAEELPGGGRLAYSKTEYTYSDDAIQRFLFKNFGKLLESINGTVSGVNDDFLLPKYSWDGIDAPYLIKLKGQ